jgi:hypothetical protein
MIRTRWYLTPAKRDPITGRLDCALATIAGPSAYCLTTPAPNQKAALVRVTQEVSFLDAMERHPSFESMGAVNLRLATRWARMDRAAVDRHLTHFGLSHAQIPDQPIGDVIDTMLKTMYGENVSRSDSLPGELFSFRVLED